MHRSLRAVWLGRRRYEPTHALMLALAEARHEGRAGDTLLLLEHESTITLGRGAHAENVLVASAERERRGVELVETGRGGDVTYHGPGQLVAYPVVDLKPDRCDVRRYVRDLMTVMERLCAAHGVGAGSLSGSKHIGTWVDRASPSAWPGEERAADPAKIGAIGVRLSRWITTHGFALNGTTDLRAFQMIVPCGIVDHGVTSIEDLTGKRPTTESLARESVPLFGEVLDAEVGPLEDLSRAEVLEGTLISG